MIQLHPSDLSAKYEDNSSQRRRGSCSELASLEFVTFCDCDAFP